MGRWPEGRGKNNFYLLRGNPFFYLSKKTAQLVLNDRAGNLFANAIAPDTISRSRQAAETCRLAACAPQKRAGSSASQSTRSFGAKRLKREWKIAVLSVFFPLGSSSQPL